VRGTVCCPRLGKTVRVLVMRRRKSSRSAGSAPIFGGEDMVTKIMGGWTDYDAVIATQT